MTDAYRVFVNTTAKSLTNKQERTLLWNPDLSFSTPETTLLGLSIPLNRSNQHSDNTCGRKGG